MPRRTTRYARWRGQWIPSSIVNNPIDVNLGECTWCGGTGVQAETIDEEREDAIVHCPHCRMWCGPCRKWVKRYLHQCQEVK